MDITPPSLWALTGERGIGKTTFCRALVELARADGWDVAGLLSPATFETGIKTGILAQGLRTDETRPLAIAASGPRHSTFELPLGDWLFSPPTLAWGNGILKICLPCDLFIVDELGPLELIRAEGWVNALAALRRPDYKIGIVVIRPELLEAARKTLPIMQAVTIKASDDPVLQARVWWNRMRATSNKS